MALDMVENPLSKRYASKEMARIFSVQNKFGIWRRLWLALAESQRELGLTYITETALAEMGAHLDDLNIGEAEQIERSVKHDVMSHIKAWGLQCPNAIKIIHLGATSCFVTDNADLIQVREGMRLIRRKILGLISSMSAEARRYSDLATLGYTHLQPAQLTTVGKRICLWIHDMLFDFHDLDRMIKDLPFRGVKGTTGSQASFLALFENDHAKVLALDQIVTKKAGFDRCVSVSGQTYTRKIDFRICSVLSGIAQSVHKMCTDLRLLASFREIEEPFGVDQIGSSAMAYKRNPMRCERACSLARHVNSLLSNTVNTCCTQWLERTLDDSANRRITLTESFLAIDSVLDIARSIFGNLQVWPSVIAKRVKAELPFMATEAIIMASVRAGGDRQQVHEAIRVHSLAAARAIKQDGAVTNDLLERLGRDPLFAPVAASLAHLADPAMFVGRAPQQVEEFLEADVNPLLKMCSAEIDQLPVADLNV